MKYIGSTHMQDFRMVRVDCGDKICDLWTVEVRPHLEVIDDSYRDGEIPQHCEIHLRRGSSDKPISLIETEAIGIACGLIRAMVLAGKMSDEDKTEILGALNPAQTGG